MTKENEDRSSDSHDCVPTSQAIEHIIRVVRPDGMICDIAMTDEQLKETLHFIRTSREDMMKLTFNDAVLELLRIGAVSVVRHRT